MCKEDGKPVLDYCLKQEKENGVLFGIFLNLCVSLK